MTTVRARLAVRLSLAPLGAALGAGAAVAYLAGRPGVRWVGLGASLVVAAVLLFAGANKLADRESWSAQADELGVPPLVASIVPVIELGLGALSAVGLGWPVVPTADALVLAGFTAVIVGHLSAGRAPRCGCFGAWSVRPVATRDVVRNSLLIALAVLSLLR